MDMFKTCGNCMELKTLSDFHLNCASKDGHTSLCKVCRCAKKKIYRAANLEKIAAQNKIWYYENHDENLKKSSNYYYENKEVILKRRKPYMKVWRTENRDHLSEYDRVYRKENKEAYDAFIKPYLKKWAQENKDLVNAISSRNRAKKINATPSWRDDEAIKVIYKESQRLTRETGVIHHVDHIVPLNGENVCGLHWEGNLQILTQTQNLSKGNKHDE